MSVAYFVGSKPGYSVDMSDTKAKKIRGVYEHPSASGIYWVQWFDSLGKRHREKAGTKSAAIKLKAKRTTDKLEARKIPATLKHTAEFRFSELCANAMTHAEHENGDSAQSNLRGVINTLTPDFRDRQAYTITTAELLAWLRSEAKRRKWSDGTYNHYVVQLCVIFRIGQENKKVATNPARGIKRRMLDNDRPRYLNSDEAERLETTIAQRWPEHRPAYQFARNTGLRAGAQFNLKWPLVDMQRKTITLPTKRNSKYRKNRELPLNAYQALVEMRTRSHASDRVFAEPPR
jgi:integrase